MVQNLSDLHHNSEPLGTLGGFVSEFIEAVKPLQYSDGFSHRETVQSTECFDCYGVPRDSVLLAEGECGDFLIIFLTGAAVVCRGGRHHRHVVAQVLFGQMTGEIGFIDGQLCTASCVTVQPSDVAVLSDGNFNALLANHPRLGN